jgi:hypothetical protein
MTLRYSLNRPETNHPFELKLFILKLRFETYKEEFGQSNSVEGAWIKIARDVNDHFQSNYSSKQVQVHLSWLKRLYNEGLERIRRGQEPPNNWDIVSKYYSSDGIQAASISSPLRSHSSSSTKFDRPYDRVPALPPNPTQLQVASRDFHFTLKRLEETIFAFL